MESYGKSGLCLVHQSSDISKAQYDARCGCGATASMLSYVAFDRRARGDRMHPMKPLSNLILPQMSRGAAAASLEHLSPDQEGAARRASTSAVQSVSGKGPGCPGYTRSPGASP